MAGSPDQSGDILLGDDCALVFFSFFFSLFFRFVSASFFLFSCLVEGLAVIFSIFRSYIIYVVNSAGYIIGILAEPYTLCILPDYSMLPTITLRPQQMIGQQLLGN